jgi:hypothetical protein
LTPDPSTGVDFADPGSWNRYGYVAGDPINFYDPGGMARCSAVGSTTTHPNPDDAMAVYTTWEIQCTSNAGSVFEGLYVTFPNDPSDRDAQGAMDSLASTVDQLEMANFNDLLRASILRVQADLANPDCAKDYRDAGAASKKAGAVGFSHMGQLQYTQQNGKIVPTRRTPGVGRRNPFTGSINLNSDVNWASPSSTFALLDGASYMVDLLGGQAAQLGVASVTAGQFMDLTILHELSHYNGAIGNPDRDPRVERALWNDCIK